MTDTLLMKKKYIIFKLLLGISILFAFSGCNWFGPEYGLFGGERVNPSGVNQLFDKKFEELEESENEGQGL